MSDFSDDEISVTDFGDYLFLTKEIAGTELSFRCKYPLGDVILSSVGLPSVVSGQNEAGAAGEGKNSFSNKSLFL